MGIVNEPGNSALPPPATAASSLRGTRGDLESDDPRRRLAALTRLAQICSESKTQQHAVGAFLREPTTTPPQTPSSTSSTQPSTQRLLQIVLTDLSCRDRTVRCAAARLICQLAYENLVNQESIMQLTTATTAAFTPGWLHIFSIPPSVETAYESQCSLARKEQTHRGRIAFFQDMVADHYGSVNTDVSRYYATGCQSFLPLCWRFPHVAGEERERIRGETDDQDDFIPDPAEHLLGFYLVPRQTQFPEQDDFYNDDLVGAMDASDRLAMQNVKTAFDRVAQATHGQVPVEKFLKSCAPTSSDDAANDQTNPLAWLVTSPENYTVTALSGYMGSLTKPEDACLTWNETLIFSSVHLNSTHLAATFGASTLTQVSRLFLRLALTPALQITATTNAWLPVLITEIQRVKPSLPESFKRQVRSLDRNIPYQQNDQGSEGQEDWRVLLRVKLEQVTPVSWAVFLAQWRAAVELERRLDQERSSAAPQRRTSVCSVSNLRRSIIEQMQPRSYKDLDQLRRELPNAYRSASQQNLTSGSASARSLSAFQEEAEDTEDHPWQSDCNRHLAMPLSMRNMVGGDERLEEDEDDEEEEDTLEYNLSLFHRMQHSLAELDALGVKKLQERQQEKTKLLETVAQNKKRVMEEKERKRIELMDKQHEFELKQADLEVKRATERAAAHEQRQQKRASAMQRKQQSDDALEARQLELAEKIQLRDQELERHKMMRQPPPRQSYEEPAPSRVVPTRPLSAKRPQSARVPPTPAAAGGAVAPEILRQRAQLYGQVVSKIYTAGAAQRPPATPSGETAGFQLQPHHLTRSFSIYKSSSFNVKAPVVKLTSPVTGGKPRSSRSRRALHRGAAKAQKSDSATQQQQRDADEAEEEEEEDDESNETRAGERRRLLRTRALHSPPTVEQSSSSSRPAHFDQGNACSTLVMRNAALAISERIRIPDVPAPAVEDPSVPPYVIAAQYEALDDKYKRNFRDRFNLKTVSHRLSYAVLKQYTKMVRREMAWQAFHDKCTGLEKVKYGDFVGIAQTLGICESDKKLLRIARQLDVKKSGHIEWKAFYTWWSMQYSTTTT